MIGHEKLPSRGGLIILGPPYPSRGRSIRTTGLPLTNAANHCAFTFSRATPLQLDLITYYNAMRRVRGDLAKRGGAAEEGKPAP